MAYTKNPWNPVNLEDSATMLAWMKNIENGIANAGTGATTLTYDTTGVADAGPALQAMIDAGNRDIVIPPGVFYANTAVFDDLGNADQRLKLRCYGVRFKAGTGLPTVAEFDTQCTTYSRPTGCKFFLFPNTLRSALSGGVVTCTNNYNTGSYLARVPVNPHLIVEGGAFSANTITKYNAGFVYGNRGGATLLRECNLSSARTLLSWTDYVDGNAMHSCSGWADALMDATYDVWLWSGGSGGGDGCSLVNMKVDNYMGIAWMAYCNGAHISGTISGGFYFDSCHGITITGDHVEAGATITAIRNSYYIRDSDITVDGGLFYTTDSLATSGSVYLDDSGTEGKGSKVELRNCNFRDWITTTDPSGGWAIYINKMGNPSRIRARSCVQSISTSGALFAAWGRSGLKISGNAANESTLAAAIADGRDLIASGDFDMVKYTTSTIGAGQDQAIPIVTRAIGNRATLRQTRNHAIPTFYDTETSGTGTGTLTNAQLYSYTASLCNTLPDGSATLQYGQAPAEWTETAGASGVCGFEIYIPTAAHGATLVVWRKTGTGVAATPDRYVIIPVQGPTTRLLDMGVNINKIPWLTTSIPVPNTVAAINHTSEALYLGASQITIP